jgi:alkylhydroperoxidase family enzyme
MAQVVAGGMTGPWKTELLRPEVQAILPFLEKLTLLPEEITPDDAKPLREAGLTDDAIRDAIAVCAAFNMIDRLADAFHFDVPTTDDLRGSARFLLKMGYKL